MRALKLTIASKLRGLDPYGRQDAIDAVAEQLVGTGGLVLSTEGRLIAAGTPEQLQAARKIHRRLVDAVSFATPVGGDDPIARTEQRLRLMGYQGGFQQAFDDPSLAGGGLFGGSDDPEAA